MYQALVFIICCKINLNLNQSCFHPMICQYKYLSIFSLWKLDNLLIWGSASVPQNQHASVVIFRAIYLICCHAFILEIWGDIMQLSCSVLHPYFSCQLNTDIPLFNSLSSCDAKRRERSGSNMAQVMVRCLTAPNHYMNQCWLITNKDIHPRPIP